MIWVYVAACLIAAFAVVFVWSWCAAAKRGDEIQSRVDRW